jgi:cytochrome c biogenesis protein CcdA/thiol-disulfide isomerase/thioredoxin
MGVLIPIAFLAGIVTAISPCVLPVLPVAMAGAVTGGKRRPFGVIIGFVITLVVFTLALTEALEAIGLSPSSQRNLGVILLVAFGLSMIIPAFGDRVSGLLAPLTRVGSRLPKGGDGFIGGIVMGAGLGLVWAPCAGPVFSAIAAANATGTGGAGKWLVLFVYAIGAALPMLAIMFGGQKIANRLKPRAMAVRAGMGVLLVASGALIFTGLDTRLTAWVVDSVPGYTETLQAAERTGAAADALDDLQGRDAEGSPLSAKPTPATTAAQQPGAQTKQAKVDLPVYGDAPEIAGISTWFNDAGTPHKLSELRGKVVLIDFWTYSCVNCIRTLPHIREWDRSYRDKGLTIVGVHTPEFAFEKDPKNVGKAIKDLGVTWPVALDPDYGTWNAWGNRYWPAKYLIDKEGKVRAYHFGEGGYDVTENQIRALLAETGPRAKQVADTAPQGHAPLTPESYLGFARMDRFDASPEIAQNKPQRYSSPETLADDHLAYSGTATVHDEDVEAGADFAIDLAFRGREVFLVLGGDGKPLVGQVLLDGRPIPVDAAGSDIGENSRLVVTTHRLYRLVKLPKAGSGRLTIKLAPGTHAYAFTFG